jgi:hypothetical protein
MPDEYLYRLDTWLDIVDKQKSLLPNLDQELSGGNDFCLSTISNQVSNLYKYSSGIASENLMIASSTDCIVSK